MSRDRNVPACSVLQYMLCKWWLWTVSYTHLVPLDDDKTRWMLVKKIFLWGAAEIFSAASFWEGGNVNGRRKNSGKSENEGTASGAGQYPVSYTHLAESRIHREVYVRFGREGTQVLQRISWTLPHDEFLYLGGNEKEGHKSVSYTHLDVYKRQMQSLPRKPK